MVSFIISLGEAFGVGIGGVVFQNQWSKHIQQVIVSETIDSEFILSYKEAEQAAFLITAFPAPIQTLYRTIMANVIDTLFAVLAVFSGVAFLVSLLSRDLSMDRETRSSQQFQEKKRTTYKREVVR